MSWYFLGGFSAYLMVPSGRWRNHRDVAHPGMIGGTLKGDVQGDLDTVFAAAARRWSKSASVPSWDGSRWPPSARADAPGAAGIVGSGGERVVWALAEASADGMNRRQIKHIEAHLADIGQPFLDILEGAVTARLRGGRSAGTTRTRRRSGRAPDRR